MMGTYLSFYFYFFLKAKTQISALVEFTESFLQYRQTLNDIKKDIDEQYNLFETFA